MTFLATGFELKLIGYDAPLMLFSSSENLFI